MYVARTALLAIMAGTALGACATKRAVKELSGAKYRLRHIDIEGNDHLSDDEIREYLNLQETTWFPLPDRHFLHEGFVPVDSDRIETLYDRHGYYDAEVVDVQIDRNERKEIADITFVVEENPPTLVEHIHFHWSEGPPAGPPDRRATPEKIETHCGLTIEKPFDTEEMHASEATMQAALANRGYAFAEVKATARVNRDAHTAQVEFELKPGPWVRIGRMEIKGLVGVPEKPVRVEIEDFAGKPYSPSRIERIESAVYAMDVFGSVVVEEAKAPRDGFVDLVITVRESKPQRVELGVGLGLQPIRWEQFGAVRYRHSNLGGTLTQFDAQLKAGYAELPAIYDPKEHGPILKFQPSLRKKGLLEKKLVWALQPQFELGIQEGYQFYAPSNRIGVSRFFTRFVEVGLSHNVRFVDFFDTAPALRALDTNLGLDFRDPYILSYIELDPKLHLTDRLLDPHNGAVLGATYDLAGGIFGGQFDYQKVTPELRAYWTPIRRRLQLALRAQTALIFPFGDEPGAPIDLRLYLGGTNTMRGWGMRRLSPYITDCVDDSCQRIPVGGNTSVLGNLETRVRVWRDLWTVAFFDMGDVQPGVATYRPGRWNYSVGPGVRYHSKIGTFRLDVGVRLNDPPEYAHLPQWALHFGLGESF